MTRRLITAPSFERAYRKFTRRHPELKAQIGAALRGLEADAFGPRLHTHKLSGRLAGLLACSCGYDCRIVFEIVERDAQEVILLVDIGTHDEVY